MTDVATDGSFLETLIEVGGSQLGVRDGRGEDVVGDGKRW